MTENEAKAIKLINDISGDYKCFSRKLTHEESLTLDRLLVEIQQYRAIGTVESLKNLPAICDSLAESSKKAEKLIEELQAYREIGTIEEFKALKEKSADIEKIIESIKQLPTQDFMGVLHIPRTATINRIKRGGNCELPEV